MPCWYILCADDMSTGTFSEVDLSNLAVENLFWSFGFAACKRTERWTMRFYGLESSKSFHAPCPASCGRNIFDNMCVLSCFTLYNWVLSLIFIIYSITILLSWRLVSFSNSPPQHKSKNLHWDAPRDPKGYSQLLTPHNAINIDQTSKKHLQVHNLF